MILEEDSSANFDDGPGTEGGNEDSKSRVSFSQGLSSMNLKKLRSNYSSKKKSPNFLLVKLFCKGLSSVSRSYHQRRLAWFSVFSQPATIVAVGLLLIGTWSCVTAPFVLCFEELLDGHRIPQFFLDIDFVFDLIFLLLVLL